MPEAPTPGNGTGQDGVGAGKDGDGEGEFFLGTYKDREAAAKGLQEKDATIARLANAENDRKKLADEVQRLQHEVLTKLVDRGAGTPAAQPTGPSEAEQQKQWEELEETVRQDPGKATRLAAQWARQAQEEAERKADVKIAEAERRLTERMVKQSDEYRKNKAAVDMLTQSGVAVDKALEVIAALHASTTTPPAPVIERLDPPGTMGGGAGGGDGEGTGFDDTGIALMERMLGRKMTKEEIALQRRGGK
jgi:hypothetical protein